MDDYKDKLNEEYRKEHQDEENDGMSVEEMDELQKQQEYKDWQKEHGWD